MIATIGEHHSHHMEGNSKNEAILVSDSISAGWEGPLYLREDGSCDVPADELQDYINRREYNRYRRNREID
jgi:hypothetical protein